MKQVISTEKKPIKMWLTEIEDGALEQAKHLANLPFIHKHVALMPDSHLGYSMPIGGVIATTDVVLPCCVGFDIGCGMCAIKTTLTDIDTEMLKRICGFGYLGGISNAIPLGMSKQKNPIEWNGFDNAPIDIQVIRENIQAAKHQLGTLGGGNHFIEIQKSNDGYIWIMLHSGSRNFGYRIADEFNKKAIELCRMWYSNVPLDGEDKLAFLPIDSIEGIEYIEAMEFALLFALENRMRMLYKIMEIIKSMMKKHRGVHVSFETPINIHHNYAALENHFGKNVWVHRKGATRARNGEIGIIPGSQGTKSYIVRGKGNPGSFCSCSHGAGRKLGRKKATITLDLSDEQRKLDSVGVIHSVDSVEKLDEAPGAYKDINVVMDNQKDLVEIITELRPLAVVKG